MSDCYSTFGGTSHRGKVALIDCKFNAGPNPIQSKNPEYHVRVVTSLPEVLADRNDQIMKDWIKSDYTGDFSSAALCTYIIQERKSMAIELHNLKAIDSRLYDMFKTKGRPNG